MGQLQEPMSKETREAIENRKTILGKRMVKVTISKDGTKSV
jgi:hypothetical protein